MEKDRPISVGSIDSLEIHIHSRLSGQIRNFRLVLRDGGLVLQGHALTYHAKQLAQHAVTKASTLPIVANDIEVS